MSGRPPAFASVNGWAHVELKTNMKTAEQWYSKGGLNNDASEIQHRREIQADALRHAAKMARKHDGLSIMAAGWIEREAEQLEAASAPNAP